MDTKDIVTLEEILSLIKVKVDCKPTLGQVGSKDLGKVLSKIVKYFHDNIPVPKVTAPMRILAKDLIDGTTYINNSLHATSSFTLEMNGIGLLNEGEEYDVLSFPQRGFKLINLTLGENDFIILTGAFASPEPGGYSDLYALYQEIKDLKSLVLKISPSQLEADGFTYKNSNLTTNSFVLEMSGVGILQQGVHYDILPFPEKGFKLRSNVVIGPNDVLSLVGAFISPEPGGYSDVYSLYEDLKTTKVSIEDKNKPDGYAGLDANGRFLAANLTESQIASAFTNATISEFRKSGGYYSDILGKYTGRGLYIYEALNKFDGTPITDGDVDNIDIFKFTDGKYGLLFLPESAIDVRDCGAVADNGTTDNTIYFQKAVERTIIRGGGEVYIPTSKNRFRINGTVYINKPTTLPISIIGGSVFSSGTTNDFNPTYGSILEKITDGDMFRVNLKADGSPYRSWSDYALNVAFKGLSFTTDGLHNVVGIREYRTRGIYTELSFHKFSTCILQDENKPVGYSGTWDNYCDMSVYEDIRISNAKEYGLCLTHNDAGSVRRVYYQYPLAEAKCGIRVHYSFGMSIENCLHSDGLNQITDKVDSYFIHLKECTGIKFDGLHIENSKFDSVFYLDRCFGISIGHIHERFYSKNMFKMQGCRNIHFHNLHAWSSKIEGYFDINDNASFPSTGITYTGFRLTQYAPGDFTTAPTRSILTNSDNLSIGFGLETKLDLNPAVISLRNTTANATNKTGSLQVQHYLNAEEDVANILGINNSIDNIVIIGGGSSSRNAATMVDIFAAINNSTTTGTRLARFTTAGLNLFVPLLFNGVAGNALQKLRKNAANTSIEFVDDFHEEAIADLYTDSGSTGAVLNITYTKDIPAGTIGAIGTKLLFEFSGSLAVNTITNNQIVVKFGNVTLYTSPLFSADSAGFFELRGTLIIPANGQARITTKFTTFLSGVGLTINNLNMVDASGFNFNLINAFTVSTKGSVAGDIIIKQGRIVSAPKAI